VNAHKLITKANESSADVLFILDCFFPTESITQWKREDNMTEIIIAGREMHNVNGRSIAGPENFDEGFSNAMRDILDHSRGEARQTIPRIMGRDTSLCTTPLRYWLNRPDRMHPEVRVWRFFFDIGRLRAGDGDRLQLRRCMVTGRRRGEFGGDPDLDNDGWGSDDGNDGDDGDARHDGGGNDGDSDNGGWGRGFGRRRLRTAHREENPEDEDDAGNNDKGNGDQAAKLYAQLKHTLDLPDKMTNEDAGTFFKRLESLPRHLRRKQRSSGHSQQQLPTPSSSGIRKRARDSRPAPADAGARAPSEIATRPRRTSPVSPDCEIVTTQRVGHELGSPINLSGATENNEGNATPPDSARRENVKTWLQDFLSPFAEEDDDKALIKRSDSPVPRAGGDDTGAARRESSMESDLEITFVGPVNRPFDGRGALIDLTDAPIDLTDDLE
jgi:hypothetical protein